MQIIVFILIFPTYSLTLMLVQQAVLMDADEAASGHHWIGAKPIKETKHGT